MVEAEYRSGILYITRQEHDMVEAEYRSGML